jgi:N-acetylneuraminic acid mutarotase
MIIACSGGKSCWEYDVKQDSWSVIAAAPFTHNSQPGVVYQKKIYVMDESSPQVFDPSSKTWSGWPSPPHKSGQAPWMVGWMDCIILLGGLSYLRGVQIFNVTKQTWTVMDSSPVPMDMYWSSSLVLSNRNVLIVGSEKIDSRNSASFYNPNDNSWVKLPETTTSHRGTRLIHLGSRTFAIEGVSSDLTEEFELETNTWTPVDVKLQVTRGGFHSLLALPARLFSHLLGGCQGVE